MSTWGQDLRFALRILRRNPGFAAVAITVLGLGIGVNSAIFSLLDAVTLRELPFRDPGRLVQLMEVNPGRGISSSNVCYLNLRDWQEQSHVLEETAYFNQSNFNLTGRGEPERLQGLLVSPSFFRLLGLEAATGRTFLPEDGQAPAGRPVVIGKGLRRRRFGPDAAVLGKILVLDDRAHTVIGVLPQLPGLSPPVLSLNEADVFVLFDPGSLENRDNHFLTAYGRLADGITLDQARSELVALARRLEGEYPDSNRGWGVRVDSLKESELGEARMAFLILQGVVGFVLLIACANVAGLLVARASSRRRETAVRAALGAGRWRLLRQMMTESLLLALLGSAAGLVLTTVTHRILLSALPFAVLDTGLEVLNLRVLAFTLGLACVTAFIFGSLPAWRAARPDPQQWLRDASGQPGGRSQSRLGGALVSLEVALTLTLLLGAGLLMNSLLQLRASDPGFDVSGLLTLRLDLSQSRYDSEQRRVDFQRRLLERLQALPQVESAALVSNLPLGGSYTNTFFRAEGQPRPRVEDGRLTAYQIATEGYLKTMGIPLLRGRGFDHTDDQDSVPVVLVNQAMAQQLWPQRDPLGERIVLGRNDARQVVGLVADAVNDQFGKAPPQVILPYAQRPRSSLRLIVKGHSDAAQLASPVRRALMELDPNQPVYQVSTMRQLVNQAMLPQRMAALLMASFAGLALLLASLGIYGLVSYSVGQRRSEIGLRLALGAPRQRIFRLVAGQGIRFVLIGAAVGAAAGLGVGRLMESFLFEIGGSDPLTFAAVGLLLAGVALAACYLPARRAIRLDPARTLRCE